MNTHSIYRSALVALSLAAAALVGCESSGDLDSSQGEGLLGLHISISVDGSASDMMRSSGDGDSFDYSQALSNSVMKIYNASGGLIRRYEPLTDAPESIYLTEGNYSISITAGESLTPTEDQADLTFSGSESFTITAAETTTVTVDCAMLNNTVAVVFADSVAENIEEGYEVTIAPASEIDATVLSSSYKNKKVFTESGVVYFIQPTGVTDLAWQFEGVRKLSGGEQIVKSGVINNVVAGEYNALTFSYDKEFGLSATSIVVDTDEEEWDDDFIFKPQPTILGIEFDMDVAQVADGSSYTMSVEAINDVHNVEVIYGDYSVSPMVDGAVVSVEGASYEVTTSLTGELTIDHDFFANIGAGGEQQVTIKVADNTSSTAEKIFKVETSGITTFSNYDFWGNTATLSASIVDPALSSSTIGIEYRSVGATTWRTYQTTTTDSKSYSATTEAYWSEAKTNTAGLTYYTLDEGVAPENEYECRMVVDGVARPSVVVTSASTTQSIPYGDLDDSNLSCWGTSNESSTTWGSGNNTYSQSLCLQGSRGDARACAMLSGTIVQGVFAAGNIFLGQFVFNGITAQTGTLGFGQSFTWTARPKSIKLRYSASIAEGEMTHDGVTYSHDRGRIYFAIVDWSGRHEVTAGNGTPSGVWDPETETSVDKGNIIGYASTYIDESTSGTDMYDMELDVYYYDNVTNPSTSAISIVLLCTTSAYGDYTTGVSGTKLWVDDFEFGY